MLSIESESSFEGSVPSLDLVTEALRDLIDLAENTKSVLAERDLVAAAGYKGQQQTTEGENTEDHASGSGTCHHDTPHESDSS